MATKPENVNPFAKYVEQSGEVAQENPFAKFVAPALDVEKLKAETKKYEQEVPFTQRITDPLKQGIANLSGMLPGLEVSSIQKEINAIREGKRGPRDPLTGEQLPFQPEEQENAIKMLQEQQKQAQAKVMSAQAEAGKFQTRPAVAALSNVDSAREAFQAFQVDPLGVMSSVSLQSLPQIVPSLILGAVTRNPTVGALAMGSTSFAGELSSGVSEYFQEQGINIKDPVEVNKALNDPTMFAKAYEYALTRGSIIGVADTAAAGLASKLLVPKNLIKNQFAKEAVNIGVAQPVAQIISGAGGEAAAQLATEGEVTKPGQVLLEAAGEGPSSVLETAAFGGKRALDRLKATPTEAPPAPAVEPAPPAPDAAAPSAIITEEDLDEGLTPVSPTAPTPAPAAPAAVTPTAPPLPTAPTAEIAQRIEELDAELKAIDAAYATATPDQFGKLNARQGEIKSEIARLFQAGTTGAPVEITPVATETQKPKKYTPPEKKPNDAAIEAEGFALVEELKKLGDNASGDGLKINLERRGGFTNADQLKYYKDKLVEAQQKVGKAPEMPKETFNLENYIRSENKTEVKRFNEFLPKAPAEVQDLVAKSNNYLQAITDKVNSKGYKVSDISGSVDFGEMRDLRNLLSGIAGTTFLYVKNAEHIAKQNRFANPDKLAKAVETLEQDFANADRILGAAPAAPTVEATTVEGEKPKTELQQVMEKEEKLESPTISKKSVIPHATVYVAPYKDGFVSGFQYYGGEKSQVNISTPLYLENIYPTRQEAIDVAAKEIRERAEEDKNKVALKWLDTVSTPVATKTQAEINRERQAKKKAAVEKPAEVAPKIEDIVSPEVAASMKDIEFQNRLIKANKEKSITENQFSKLFKLYQDGKTPQADEQLTKMLAKNEKKAKAKEEPEEITGTELKESESKSIPAQEIVKAGNKISNIRYAQDGKIAFTFNGQDFLIKEPSDVILVGTDQNLARKWIAKRYGFLLEPFSTNKETHIEGKKSEPVTTKTIEEAIDKAESNVDSKKIKTAIKNQFDQAIKRAKIQTEKEWSDAKGLLPVEKFVTISVPGDGQFKVKNNVERLKELQTKMVNATTPKGPTVQTGPSSGAIEAFKGMVDDKDMENAIEYAKLKGLDPKTVKLNPTQRSTVDNYLKNPAEFERQQEESEQMAEARQTALRADQEKRTRERLEADEKREEEARFKAVLDTTIRSTQPQLKGDIAKRKITSADAARMLEVIPGLPTGTVKPYVIKELTKLAKSEKPADKPYFNDFTSNIDYNELYKRAEISREDRIKEYAQTRAASRRMLKKIAKYGSDIPMQRELNELLNKEEMLKVAVGFNKPVRNSADDFMARATQELANENLAPEVEAVIRQVYEKYPGILEGLKLSLRTSKAGNKGAGNFNPYERIVTLWKDSSGVENASTIRHELTHSLEQIMTPEARQAVVEAWARSFENAIKRNPDKKSQEFFNKVFDFLDRPSKETFDAATNVMPSYDFYQYMNPSEYWAVNAEKLMAAKLGTPWARFVSAVKKLLEALKSVFGVNNTYTVHKEFDNIINGKIERTKDEEMLVDYLLQGKVKLDFLNNIEDVNELLDKHNRPDAPRKPSLSVRDAFMGGYDNTKETVKDVLTSPLIATNNMIGKADRALTYFRNKNIFFGYGLEEADRQRYGGQVRTAHQQAIASVAVVNALHSGNIATQVMTQGKLIFDNAIQMFVAVKSNKSMANVVREKAKLIDKLGFETGNRVIQSYFEAKRSRSIVNEYLNREAAYEAAIEAGQNEEEARRDLANIEKAVEKVNMDDEAIDDFIALENQYPELRNMMDNWTAVNQNMIDMMEFSGLISKQRAKSLRSIKDYVPWYRIMDDQEDIHSAPKNTRGLTNVAADKKFGPGKTDRDIDDIVDNMIHNVLTITRNTARNYAANRVVMEYGERYTEGKKAGKLRVFPKEGSDAEGVRFNIIANGRRIVVRIQDPLVAESVIGLENIDIPMNGALAFMANTLRRSITTFPAFQVAQLFMDAPTAALVTGLKRPDKVWAGVFTSFLKNLRKDDPIVAKLRAAGIGGYQSSARTPEKEIQLDIGLIQGSWFSKAMKGLDRFGDASDYAQRRSVYIQTMKETGDEMLALFQANNVIDFKKRGSGQIAQIVTRQVAFMNAYAQAIDVLAKGLAGTGLKGIERRQALARMAAAGMMLASATLVYCFLVGDDEEYNKLDDQTKMRTIFIPGLGIRLPMHSGAAFFFKAIPELLYNAITKEGTKDEYDRKRLTRALSKAAADALLGPNPTPTGVKPVIEIALNRNFFTGGQVTPRGMEDLAAFRQYNQNTSELGKIISALTGTEKTRLLNPIEADHLIRGLTGTIGASVMWGTNLLSGDRPTAQAKDNPMYGQFIMPDVPRGREDLYYDLKEKTDEAYKTYTDLQRKGRKEEAAEWFKENKKLIQVYGYTSGIEVDLKRLNGEIRRLADLPGEKMSPDAKRKRMTELQEIKGRMLKDVISMRKRAGFDE